MTFLQQLHWREPLWLLLGLQPALLWLIHRIWQGRQLTAYADRNLWPWIVLGNQANWRTGLVSRTSAYTLAWLLFCAGGGRAAPAAEYPAPQCRYKYEYYGRDGCVPLHDGQ